MPVFSLLAEACLLVAALSVDTLVASFSYGLHGIRVPWYSCLVLNGICTGTLLLALLCGSAVASLLPSGVVDGLCFAILFLIGLAKLFDGMVKAWIAKRKHAEKQLSFRLFSLHMILRIYADATEADYDSSRVLSVPEAAGLAMALSFDSLAAGIGAGIQAVGIWMTAVLSFLAGILAVCVGVWLGRRLKRTIPWDLSWLSGALLIVLAFCK